jgi:hypothetical protein
MKCANLIIFWPASWYIRKIRTNRLYYLFQFISVINLYMFRAVSLLETYRG